MAITNPFGRFFDDPRLEKVEGFINGILAAPLSSKDTESETYSSRFIDDVFEKEKDKTDVDALLSQFTIPAERLQRYAAYEEVFKSVPMIKRVVKVYKSYIIQKNPVTNLWYLLRKTDYNTNQQHTELQKASDSEKFFKQVIKNFKLQEHLKNEYVHNQLLFGDCYVEVVDLKKEKEKVDLKKISIINEDVFLNDLQNQVNKFNQHTSSLIYEDVINSIANKLVRVNEAINEEEIGKKETQEDLLFDNVLLRTHKPHNIIVLETKYGTTLGYLEVNRDIATNPANSIAQTLSNITSRLVNTSNTDDGSISSREQIVNKIIGYILKKVMGQNTNVRYDKTVYDDLKRFIIEQNIHNRQLNLRPIEVRFIPVDRMVNFNLPSSEHHPHGSSIVEPLMLPGKLFILSQLSNIFMKLSRAPLSRKWIIDQGSVQMPGVLIQKLKRELHNNRIAIEQLGSFKSISKIMSDYKDMFVLSKNNQRAVDVEVNSLGDTSVKVADLEDARREIIALSGVPAPYLGYMDVVELREQLVHANVSFATEVIDIQDNTNNALNKLVDIIAEIEEVGFKPSNYYTMSLIPPVVLITQLVEMIMSSVGNIMGIFQTANIQFDPYYFLEKYVPYIEWDDFKEKSEGYFRQVLTKTGVESIETNPPPPPQQY